MADPAFVVALEVETEKEAVGQHELLWPDGFAPAEEQGLGLVGLSDLLVTDSQRSADREAAAGFTT